MTRPGRELSVIHGAQFAAQRLLGNDNLELVPHPLAQIDQSPAHDVIDRRCGAIFDGRLQRRTVRVVQSRWLARRLAIDQASRTVGVELHHPIADDLKCHSANLGGLGSGCPIVDCRKRQEPACLCRILGRASGGAKESLIKISPKRDRHGELPTFATLNQTDAASGKPLRVKVSGTWYKRQIRGFPSDCATPPDCPPRY
jgi:hypothetical protein